MKLKTLITALGATTALVGTADADHRWGTYHWARTSNPVPLQVVDSVTPFWQFELETALDEWNQSQAFQMSITSVDESDRTRKRCPMVSGQMRVCNASYGNNGWLGLASINLDSQGHITQGTAKMNDSYGSYFADPDQRHHVMCQEAGHVFGLGHTSEDGSSQQTCMDYSNDPRSISPNSHDYQLLADIYAHTDSYDSYAAGGSGGEGGGGTCPGKKKNCLRADNVPGIPNGAALVNSTKFSETWIKADGKDGLWVFHVRLAPGFHREHDGHDGHEH